MRGKVLTSMGPGLNPSRHRWVSCVPCPGTPSRYCVPQAACRLDQTFEVQERVPTLTSMGSELKPSRHRWVSCVPSCTTCH